MAISLHSSTAWAGDTDYDGSVTSGTFSPPAGSVIMVLIQHYLPGTSITPSTTGNSLTWVSGPSSATGSDRVEAWFADNASAQTNITATANASGSYASIKVYVLEDTLAAASIVGAYAGGSGTTDPINVPTSTVNSTASNSWQIVLASDANAAGNPTSSNLTVSAAVVVGQVVSGYKTLGTAPEALSGNLNSPGSPSWNWITFEVKPVSTTTHTADASLTVTASRTATTDKTTSGGAAPTTTATVTAGATVERVATATQTVTATTTATATADRAAASTTTVTATITATADVTGSATGSASLDVTATTTATAAVERVATAALSAVAAIAATLVNESEVTPGTMRALTLEGATMRPAGSTGATMRVGLLGLNAATMTAVVSDEGTPTTIGVPVFAGPTDPVTAGLITAGTPHVWFHDGTVFVQE